MTILLKLEWNIYLALCNRPSDEELHTMEKKCESLFNATKNIYFPLVKLSYLGGYLHLYNLYTFMCINASFIKNADSHEKNSPMF